MIKICTQLEYNLNNCDSEEKFIVYVKDNQYQHLNTRSDIKTHWSSRHEHKDGVISFSNKNGERISFEELSALINKFGYMFKP